MTDKSEENLAKEVTDKLDALFMDMDEENESGDDQKQPNLTKGETEKVETPQTDNAPEAPQLLTADKLAELDAKMLSIDWEINDENLKGLLDELDRLRAAAKNDKVLIGLITIHDIVGKYVQKNREKTHPEAVNLLLNNYKAIRRAALSASLSGGQKRALLIKQFRRVKDLKALVVPQGRRSTKNTRGPGTTSSGLQFADGVRALIQAEVKRTIQTEVKSIVEKEIAALKKELNL